MAKGTASPGSVVIRRVTRGPGKGDVVLFRANSASSQEPGKLKPRVVVEDRGQKGTQETIPSRGELSSKSMLKAKIIEHMRRKKKG